MSHEGDENLGTGLSDVLDLLVKAPPERLQSLTFQLGESPEDKIIHALCLIVLQRGAQALEKLQTLRENHLANHLAEKWQLSGGKLEDFRVHCGAFKEFPGQCLAVLARIFKVLSEQRLCNQLLRNLAYKRAVSSDGRQISSDGNLEYFQLREEAKQVCGPEFAEWMCSSDFGPYSDPLMSQKEAKTDLQVSLSLDQTETAQNNPSPLQASCSMPSFPTHLEISLPPTASFQDDKRPQETPEQSKINTPDRPVGELDAYEKPGELISVGLSGFNQRENSMQGRKSGEDSRELDNRTHPTNLTTKPTTKPKYDPPSAATILLPEVAAAKKIQRSYSSEEEEEETFYAFVILHAPEDAEKAESMRQRLEEVIDSDGAVFCEDFEIPGKSKLRSVEDAINNSAFTLLLLTRNFNTMQEVEADSALINSINKKHKYNTVIPVHPRENSMHRDDMPLVLRTKIVLTEDRHFEKKAKKAMSAAAIKKQRKMWAEEQALKLQKKKQERLKQSNQHQLELLKESKAAELLEKEQHNLQLAQKLLLNSQEQGDGAGRAQWSQQPNIHIENANYIMIGNDSRMTVGLSEAAEETIQGDEEEEEE